MVGRHRFWKIQTAVRAELVEALYRFSAKKEERPFDKLRANG